MAPGLIFAHELLVRPQEISVRRLARGVAVPGAVLVISPFWTLPFQDLVYMVASPNVYICTAYRPPHINEIVPSAEADGLFFRFETTSVI